MNLLFAGAAPDLHSGRCLNRRHAGAGCTRCVDGCPVEAIVLEGETPQLDQTTCVCCGICTAVCPTDSYSPAIDYEKTLRATVANLPTKPTALVCTIHPAPDMTAAAVSAVVQHRRCLAALTTSDLLELGAGGTRPLWLDDSPCECCPIGAAQMTLARTVEAARILLHAAGCSPALLLHSEHPPTTDANLHHAPLYDGAQPAISRRALFTRRRPAQVDKDDEPLIDDLLQRGAPLSARLPQQTPSSRRRLLAALTGLQASSSGELPTGQTSFGSVEVDVALCSGCSFCARFCPTGALHFVTEDTHFELTIQPTACIACGICVVACPEDAVQLLGLVMLSTLLADDVTHLADGELVTCAGCGMLTAARSDDQMPRCHVCRQGVGIVDAQHDQAGLMIDFLKRLPKKEIDDEPPTH